MTPAPDIASPRDNGLVLVIGPSTDSDLAAMLAHGNYRVTRVTDRASAWRWLATQDPDAIVIAARDTDSDPLLALVTELRQCNRYRATPILLLTDTASSRLLRSAFTAGCDDLLPRPLEPVVVFARLGGLVRKARYRRELERSRAELACYVSPRLRGLVETRTRRSLPSATPISITATILFSDIRDFTKLSHTKSPAELFATVNAHLSKQVAAVYRHGGYVDTFGGDGVMAIFDRPDMTRQACECALECLAAATTGHEDSMGVPVGVGLHAGDITVGNIGTGEHLNYTAIGAPVNIAARVCGLAGAGQALVSQAVKTRLTDQRGFVFGTGERCEMRGVQPPVVLHDLSSASLSETSSTR